MLKDNNISLIETILGYQFQDKTLLNQAFVRSSYSHEHPMYHDNELLELLGDTVLSTIVTSYLFKRYMERDETGIYSKYDEGQLSAIRSLLVNKEFLAKRIRKLSLGLFLKMGLSDKKQGINDSKSVLEDLFESLVGAMYLDSNKSLKRIAAPVLNLLDIKKELDELDGKIIISYKNELQERCHEYNITQPYYETVFDGENFISKIYILDIEQYQYGKGHNKKAAENDAARCMVQYLDSHIEKDYDNIEVTIENAINMLQEYCVNNNLNSPVYELIDERIDYRNNEHNFCVRCYLDGLYEDGESNRKKLAKKISAYKMLENIKDSHGRDRYEK